MSGKAYVLILGAVCFIFRDALISALSPFLLAFIISMPIKRLSCGISKKFKISKKLCGIILLFLTIFSVTLILRAGVMKLADEVSALCERLSDDPNIFLDFFESTREKLLCRGGIISNILQGSGVENAEVFLSDMFSDILAGVKESLSRTALGLAYRVPSFLLFCAVFFMSCFYFVCDDGKIFGYFLSLLSHDDREKLDVFLKKAKNVLKNYLGASLSLCMITFFIVLAGMFAIGARYAVLMSLIIGIIDFLPLLGSGCVLIPWAVICLVNSDIKTGIALLVIFAVVTVVRQISEPKIVGKNIGLHPFATLFSVYVGGELFGFSGLFLGPLIAVGIKGILQSKSIDK